MISTTAGRLWLSHGLPAKYRDNAARLDSKGVSALLDRVAREDPEDYPKVVKHLIDVGKTVAYRTGGYSFGLKSLRKPAAAIQVGDQIRTALATLYADPRTSPQEKRDGAIDAIAKAGEGYEKKVYDEALADNNPIALQVLSGSRGKPSTLQTLIGGDLMYQDSQGRPIPVPVTRSYSQGLTPAQYFAGAYGARSGVIGTKLCLMSDSLVRMADWSVKKIKDIRPEEMVLGADREGNTFPVRVTRVFDNGVRPVKRFVFRYGKSRTQTVTLEATADHKVLARTSKRTQTDSREYRETGVKTVRTTLEVRPVGDCERNHVNHTVALQPSTGFTGGGVSEPWAWWIGLLTGDGGLTGSSVYFSNNDQPLLTEFRRQLCAEGFLLNVKKGAKYEYALTDSDKALLFQTGQNRRIHRLKTKLDALGLLGKSAPEKELPVGINNWDNESVAAYIRGVFDTDGSVKASNNSTGPLISLGVTSAALVNGIRDLLAWRFGIYGQTCVVKTKGRPVGIVPGSVANHDLHELMISDRQSVRRYRDLVGFVESKKRSRLDAALLTDDQEKSGRESRFVYHYMSNEILGDLPTFDLEVDHPDHLFVLANGLIVSNSTALAGFYGKQMVGASHRLITGDLDHDEAKNGVDPNVHRGLPTDTDDKGNVGSLLAKEMGGYKRNTVLTGKILRDLKDQGLERILVRSPITSSSTDGTIYGRDAGVRERGGIPSAGDQIGIAAAQAIGEIVSQSSLGSKHGGGISKGVSQGPTGFKLLNLLAQAPKGSPFWAAHAGEDGAVKSIESSPAGGWTVRVGSGEHHVPPTAELKVKLGDRVEAGDLLSSGIPDPNELVKHLHVGEARNRFMKEFRKAVGAGSTERRNLELVSRGLINHVKMTDEHQDWLPDDVVPYDVVERSWKPREDAVVRRPHEATGQYLELPVLHYSVGCFDDKTEALTARGWVPWPEVEQTDLLATVREGRLTFERPLVLVRAPYSGELLTFEGRYIDYAVTPNHRFYVGRYHSPEKGFHFEEAQKLHGARFRIPQFGFPQTSEAVPTIRIGEYDVDYGDYAELVGWWASEGTARVKTAKNGFVKLYQSSLANPEKFEAIEQLVRRLPFPKWHYVKNKGVKWGVGISYGPLAAHLLQYGTHSHNKRLPRHLLDQPPEILSRTYDAMMAGDGAHSVTLGCRSGVYHTVSRGLADDMQELCIRAGHGAIPHYDAPKGHRGHIWRCGIALNRTVAQVGGFGQRFGKIDYDGVVYCAEMETGLLYVRRNGKPMLSGNSHIKPSVVKELQHFGVDNVTAHHQPPPFQPHFVRAMENLQNDPDFMVQHMGSNLQKSTLKAVHRGGTSDENSTSFVPSLARGKDFGKTGPIKSYALGDVSKVL